MHKAQGLTLRRVTYDAGDKEPDTAVGITFVALTRVRHPGHIVLSPFACSVERLTSGIGLKPALYHRKMHECHLRRAARKTANTWQHLNPPASAFAPLKPDPISPKELAKRAACDAARTPAGKRKTLDANTLWNRPANTQQQSRQVRQRADAAPPPRLVPAADPEHVASTSASVDVEMDQVADCTDDVPAENAFVTEEDELQEALWEEACEIDSDEERMADDMLVDAGVW